MNRSFIAIFSDDESAISNCLSLQKPLVTVSFDFYLTFTTPGEGEFCLTEILGNKIITLLSCPFSLAIGFLFYSTLLILIYTEIRLHLATVCPSGPCIELPD